MAMANASWVGPESRPQPRGDLLRQLISSPHALPPAAPRALTVAPQAPLPGNLRFGPMSPGQVTNSPFSGGVAGRSPINLVHPDAPQNFRAPSYAPLGAVQPHPLAVPLLNALTGAIGPGVAGNGIPPAPPGGSALGPTILGAPRTAGIDAAAGQQAISPLRAPSGSLSALLSTLAQSGQKIGGLTRTPFPR